ncbi:type 1 glutamine amidotransferase domain-containing protein [Longispora fulva]|uniref:Putative intracellular protease/amidase n=1 Tax=Longispora fulva TaxID=619741 RepID=A0A8J7KEB3_9ACTN|nr:type 1 glutamine amidotransferase domain-containing protein [Longispora fulva]MBG6134925.1 putative intracellular protease/amidase [Longispora fulva]
MTQRILMVLTSHDALGDSGMPTGFWLEELVAPLHAFRTAGHDVELASVLGGRPPLDPGSATYDTAAVPDLDELLATTAALDTVDPARYAGVFLVGGHGTMWDFPQDPHLARIVTAVHATGAVGAVCHGVAGLLGATAGDGTPLVRDRRVTGFSDAEESMVGADAVIPFWLQRRLADLGADVEVGAPFTEHVRRDGRLVTGQNPQSSAATAAALVEVLAGVR